MKISVIMPCYLGEYPGAATNRPAKLQRALQSFIDQPYPAKELIVVADGCEETEDIVSKFMEQNDIINGTTIKLLCIKKQPNYSGFVRNWGIEHATGNIISYLDSDDKLFGNHLAMIAQNFGDYDWVYFNDYLAMNADLGMIERESKFRYGYIGTSCIAHRAGLDILWDNGYSHDWDFVKQLVSKYSNNGKIKADGYLVCHLPAQRDF